MVQKIKILTGLLMFSMVLNIFQSRGQTKTTIDKNWTFMNEANADFQKVDLPHTWNKLDAFDEESGFYRGVGIYIKTVTLDKVDGRKFFLSFDGAATITKVYCNDQFCGEHIGNYGSFAVDISKAAIDGANQIRIEVDNSYHENVPPLSADFTFMGGLYRNVHLIETGKIHFDKLDHGSAGVKFYTPKVSSELGEVQIVSSLLNDFGKKKNIKIIHRLLDAEGNLVSKTSKSLKTSEGKYHLEQIVQVKYPSLWSPDSPYLYQLVSEIQNTKTGEVYDRVINKLGFRWYDHTAEEGLRINGKYIKLKGINRTQDYAGLGIALPDEYHWNDLKMIKEAGFNSIRLGHYQQSPVVLDACDKLGFIVTCEVPLIDEITLSEEFSSNIINMTLDLVRRDVNHPSIWGWGLSNEILLRMPKKGTKDEKNAYRSYLRNLLTRMDSVVKKEDPYRPTMSVMHLMYAAYKRAKIHNIGDVVAVNLYPGWYSGTPDQMESYARNIYEKAPDKPFLITEYGAGADPRLRSDHPQAFDFSLEYQTEMHKQWYKTIRENDFIAGSFVWVFSDFASEKRGDSEPKINSKGLVSFDRIPKDVYYYYQAELSDQPIVAIASKNWAYGSGVEDAELNELCTRKLEVYSNLEEIELLINGESLGKRKVEDHSVVWEIPFRHGKNRISAIGKTANGKQIIDCHEVDFNIIPRKLKTAQSKEIEIRVNAGSNCYFLDKEEKAVWLPEQFYSENGFGFIDGERLVTKLGRPNRIGTNYDILGTNKDPLYQTQRISLSGFQADVPAGEYEITIGLADLYKKKQKKLAYELGGEESEKESLSDIENTFTIIVNGESVFRNICPRKLAGETSALQLNTTIYTEGGIAIQFEDEEGFSYVNSMKIIKQ